MTIPPCPHPPEWLRYYPTEDQVQCGECGHVWVSRASVQARNAKVARSVMQILGTLIGGSKAPPPPGQRPPGEGPQPRDAGRA